MIMGEKEKFNFSQNENVHKRSRNIMAKWWWCYANECPCVWEREVKIAESNCCCCCCWEGEGKIQTVILNIFSIMSMKNGIERSSLWMKISSNILQYIQLKRQQMRVKSGVVSVAEVAVCEGGFLLKIFRVDLNMIFLSLLFLLLLHCFYTREREKERERGKKFQVRSNRAIRHWIVRGGCICDGVSIMRNKTFSNREW